MSKRKREERYELGDAPLPPDASEDEREARYDAKLEAQLEAIGNQEED